MNTQELSVRIRRALVGRVKEINESVSDGGMVISTLDRIFEEAGVTEQIQEWKARQFLRITAYPGCNLRCSYCNTHRSFSRDYLPTSDIRSILWAASSLGVRTVHYTGGEPTLRPDFVDLVSAAKEAGMKTIDITTNGTRLSHPVAAGGISYRSMTEALYASGLTGVSLSLDSLYPRTFGVIAMDEGYLGDAERMLMGVMEAVEQICIYSRIPGKFVVNMVVIPTNLDEIPEFIEYARRYNGAFIPRFCELQDKGPVYERNTKQFSEEHVTRERIVSTLKEFAPETFHKLEPESIDEQNAHAEYYQLDDIVAGVIAPYSQGWPCAGSGCKRIRIGPRGSVRSCSADPTLQLRGESFDAQREILLQAMYRKLIRMLNDTYPGTHHPDYARLRFGLKNSV